MRFLLCTVFVCFCVGMRMFCDFCVCSARALDRIEQNLLTCNICDRNNLRKLMDWALLRVADAWYIDFERVGSCVFAIREPPQPRAGQGNVMRNGSHV